MKISSYFLAINLDNSLFKNIHLGLRKYLKSNKLEKSVEIQNLSSQHITLYYFDDKLDDLTLKKIQNELSDLNKKRLSVYINRTNFFKKNFQNYLCYFSPLNKSRFERINIKFKKNYASKAKDNEYKYIPHSTFFKIINFSDYQKHEANIQKIINTGLKKIKKTDAFKSFNLYAVNSKKSPEEQKVVL